MTVTALIVAAGSGQRLGGGLPKQYRSIGGKPMLRHAVEGLIGHPRVEGVRVVIGEGQEDNAKAALAGLDVGRHIVGGATRSESVRNGLGSLTEGIVLIHDAARPFCPPKVVDRLLDALEDHHGAVPALPIADTLAMGGKLLSGMVDRDRMLRIQTPQAFHVENLLYAFTEVTMHAPTDESSVMVEAGLKVATVEGDPLLDKLTTPDDWARAEAMLAARMITRTGLGFDVHAFAGEGPVMLGGIAVPHDRGLAGHSDADVVLHAITDAILGAAALGDIGDHFPPSDPRWKGASSDQFLGFAAQLVRDLGAIIDHVDVTVICEAPRIGPHRAAMIDRVAAILAIPATSVSIKATTTERLGFTGRGEGIAAQALATIRMELVP